MRLGATLVHLSDVPPYPVARWARRLEDAGFESLWTPEVIGRGPLIPDPLVVLAAAAAATERIALGTATLQVPLHHPADLAHRILSLMADCGDRFNLGVSPGHAPDDFATLDRDHTTRFADFRRDVIRLRTLVARGHDERARLAPAPVPAGGPPVLLGSWGANVERAAREFDGWLASGNRTTPEEIVEAHARYRAAGGGRAVVCTIPVLRPDDLGPTGEALHRYAETGVDEAVVLIGPDGPEPETVRALYP